MHIDQALFWLRTASREALEVYGNRGRYLTVTPMQYLEDILPNASLVTADKYGLGCIAMRGEVGRYAGTRIIIEDREEVRGPLFSDTMHQLAILEEELARLWAIRAQAVIDDWTKRFEASLGITPKAETE